MLCTACFDLVLLCLVSMIRLGSARIPLGQHNASVSEDKDSLGSRSELATALNFEEVRSGAGNRGVLTHPEVWQMPAKEEHRPLRRSGRKLATEEPRQF